MCFSFLFFFFDLVFFCVATRTSISRYERDDEFTSIVVVGSSGVDFMPYRRLANALFAIVLHLQETRLKQINKQTQIHNKKQQQQQE